MIVRRVVQTLGSIAVCSSNAVCVCVTETCTYSVIVDFSSISKMDYTGATVRIRCYFANSNFFDLMCKNTYTKERLVFQ